MRKFKDNIEACLYISKEYANLFKMEDSQLPTGRYFRYVEKNVGNREFHAFPIMEIGSTGVYSAPYTEGKNTLRTCGIGSMMFMPYEVDGKIYVASPTNFFSLNFANRVFLYSSKFFEDYREKNKLPEAMDITEIAGIYMGRSHHNFCRYNGQTKYIFSREGVAVCPNDSDGLYVATTLDDSLKIDAEGPNRYQVYYQIASYISKLG